MSEANAPETRRFDTEVHQLLKLMINALYSNREIFLRELISNASDASDKLRFEALTNESLKGLDQDLAIDVRFDAEAGTLTVSDRGIGMNREEVIDNLGTIARSGTKQFLESLSGDTQKDAALIGQFGVGFYSAFIVASDVAVETRRADEPADSAVRWTSTGEGQYQLEPIEREAQGTTITLTLRDEHKDLLADWQLKRIIRHYSNHIAFPIRLAEAGKEGEADSETVNDSKALWARAKSDLSDADYQDFYTSLTGDEEKPLSWAHHHVEGSQRYSLLLYLPSQAPFDMLINRDEREGVKLYIQRVFIMDAAEQVVPRYLRFMRGVIDSADLPLNISREILQDNPLVRKIRATVVKRSLDLIEKLAEAGGDDWEKFRKAFGSVLKEGVIEDFEQRERIASLLRFASSKSDDETVGLDAYIDNMAEGQDTIWYLTADSLKVAKHSPHLEAFRKRGIEVLLLTDRIDEWLVAHLHEYKGKTLKSAASGKLDLGDEQPEPDESARTLAGRIKKALGEQVGNVIAGSRLTDSPGCIVSDDDAMSLQMQKMLRQAGQEVPESKPDLEINADHPLLGAMAREEDEGRFGELAQLLYDQALLAEGGELADPAGYVRRVNALLVNALGGTSDKDDDRAASA
ncbi:MAG: molecular chaperone HtpG [Gammaproteobacteria bacterium]|nr:molecular chaperone HtpG [Gammaproteobacteria bacterium]